jgi:hypothetical protein
VGGGFEAAIVRRAVLEDIWAEGHEIAVARQIDQLDDRLGLSPKAAAALRWRVVDDDVSAQEPDAPVNTDWTELRVVDTSG